MTTIETDTLYYDYGIWNSVKWESENRFVYPEDFGVGFRRERSLAPAQLFKSGTWRHEAISARALRARL